MTALSTTGNNPAGHDLPARTALLLARTYGLTYWHFKPELAAAIQDARALHNLPTVSRGRLPASQHYRDLLDAIASEALCGSIPTPDAYDRAVEAAERRQEHIQPATPQLPVDGLPLLDASARLTGDLFAPR